MTSVPQDMTQSGAFEITGALIQPAAHRHIPVRTSDAHSCRTETVLFRDESTEQQVAFDLPQYYELLGSIAKGTYGYVSKGKTSSSSSAAAASSATGSDAPLAPADDASNIVAIKKIPSIWNDSRFWICAIRELTIMHFVNHPKVMGLRDFYVSILGEINVHTVTRAKQQFDTVYCVMDCMDYSLEHVLRDKKTPLPEAVRDFFCEDTCHPLPLDDRRFVMFQVLCGLLYLHRCRIVHRDLKPANILLTKEWAVKICDLGQGRGLMSGSIATTNRSNCTLLYAAPETFVLGNSQSSSSRFDFDSLAAQDLWSVGCIWAELIIGLPLVLGREYGSPSSVIKTIFQLLGKPTAGEQDSLKAHMSAQEQEQLQRVSAKYGGDKNALKSILLACDPTCEQEADIICALLKYSPSDRMGLEQALNSQFFQGWFDDATDIGETSQFVFKTKSQMASQEAAREILWELFLAHHPSLRRLGDDVATTSD